MRRYARVEGSSTLIRDLRNNAILNMDNATIEKAKKAKALRKEKEKEIDELKKDVQDIKEMLNQIVERL
jgi:hypothetical protein